MGKSFRSQKHAEGVYEGKEGSLTKGVYEGLKEPWSRVTRLSNPVPLCQGIFVFYFHFFSQKIVLCCREGRCFRCGI
jgi:hypothetical protein